MNAEQTGILIGLVLGDGHIERNYCGLALHHCEEQRAYIEHKAILIRDTLGGEIPKVTNSSYKEFKSVRVRKSHPYFKTLRELMYPEGEKVITQEVLSYLTPQAMALWWMDDGSLTYKWHQGHISSRMGILYTMTTLEQNMLIRSWLIKEFDIYCTPQKQ